MTAHTLPDATDRGRVRPHPDGRAWELDDFLEDVPMEPGAEWNQDGYVVLEKAYPDDMIDRYVAEWEQVCGPLHHHPDLTVDAPRLGGHRETDYMILPSLMEMVTYKPVQDVIESLIGEPVGANLVLSGMVSTRRNWHVDHYLNPPCVGDAYSATWIALGDIDARSGPFQAIPGSHLWWPGKTITKRLIGRAVDLGDDRWPAHSEEVLTPLVQAEAARRGAEIMTYLPKRGDCLIWSSRLMHRGSIPEIDNMHRPALIWHGSGLTHRSDFPYPARRFREAGHYFPYPHPVAIVE